MKLGLMTAALPGLSLEQLAAWASESNFEMLEIACSFGISKKIALDAVAKMAAGAAKTMTDSDLSAAQVVDLIPVKPFKDEEENIREKYRAKLNGIMQKLKG